MKRALVCLIIVCLLPMCAQANLLSIEEMNEAALGLAKFTIDGMPTQAYYDAAAMSGGWITILSAQQPQEIWIDLTRKYSYADLESVFTAMSSHSIASVEVIGQSTQGRRIYSVSIGTGEQAILLTGGVHAKETAGTMYILKQLCSLLNDYADGDETTVELLSRFRIIAVPCVNPDGRAIVEEEEGIDWRANDPGVDLGMNFPSSNAGQYGEGASSSFHSTEPGPSDYPGVALGSETETRALIGWLEEYIDQAVVFIDYEQYGRYLHGGAEYLSEACQQASDSLAMALAEYLTTENATYDFLEREEELRGWSGGSIADFAAELAEGLSFSERFGRLGMDTGNGSMPLCFYEDIDSHIDCYVPRTQTPLACVTIDISTKGGTGYYENARRNHDKEYENCGYAGLLTFVMEYVRDNLPG